MYHMVEITPFYCYVLIHSCADAATERFGKHGEKVNALYFPRWLEKSKFDIY
jgi:hypothetical protein